MRHLGDKKKILIKNKENFLCERIKYIIQDSVVAAFSLFLNSVRARASHCGQEAAVFHSG